MAISIKEANASIGSLVSTIRENHNLFGHHIPESVSIVTKQELKLTKNQLRMKQMFYTLLHQNPKGDLFKKIKNLGQTVQRIQIKRKYVKKENEERQQIKYINTLKYHIQQLMKMKFRWNSNCYLKI